MLLVEQNEGSLQMGDIKAKVIAHSINEEGVELISIETIAPKFLDAEIEKHRMFSSNSSSDRAIPFHKMREKPIFIPEDVRLNEKGMQGYSNLEGEELQLFREDMKELYLYTLSVLGKWGHVHKQHLNRYLLGYSIQTKVITANKEWWDYFIGLRKAEGADPAIQSLTKCVDISLEGSSPIELGVDDWHLAYYEGGVWTKEEGIPLKVALDRSVAACARTSYSNHDGTRVENKKDGELAERLLRDGHFSCFEHQATPMQTSVRCNRNYLTEQGFYLGEEQGATHIDRNQDLWSANFKGWVQYRQLVQQKEG